MTACDELGLTELDTCDPVLLVGVTALWSSSESPFDCTGCGVLTYAGLGGASGGTSGCLALAAVDVDKDLCTESSSSGCDAFVEAASTTCLASELEEGVAWTPSGRLTTKLIKSGVSHLASAVALQMWTGS